MESVNLAENEVDWKRMQNIVMQRLRAKYNAMSESLRNLPTIPFQDPKTMEEQVLSPNDIIREVANLSELGKKIITATINSMAKMQP